MRIPNKFNGYSRDGVRLYNDPATATVAIASMGEGAAIAGSLGAAGLLGTVGTSMLGAGALAEGAALGSALFGTGLSESGVASLLPGQVSAATAPTGVAANFSAPSYLSQLAPSAQVTPLTEFQAATNQGIMGALQPAQALEIPVVNPVATMQAPVSAVPEAGIQNLMQGQAVIPAEQATALSNAAETYKAAQPAYSEGIQSLAQGRGFAVENISRPEMSIDQFRLQDYPGQYGRNPIQTDIINERVAGMQAQNGYLNPIDKSIQEEAMAKQFGVPEVRPDVVRSPEVVANTPAAVTNEAASVTEGSDFGQAYTDQMVRANAQAKEALSQPMMTGNTWEDFKTLAKKPNWANIKAFASENPYTTASALYSAYNLMKPKPLKAETQASYIRPYANTQAVNPNVAYYTPYSGSSTAARTYFTGGLEALPVYRAAAGGLASLAVGGPVEQMSAMNAVGENTMYPQADLHTPMYSNPAMQRPISTNVIAPATDTNVDPYTGEERFAAGGISSLGGYSDGGRLLRGPGDGVSDSIPASIGDRQPARLADGEFVVPARIVSEIGNGSTEAGARKLYAMMDRVQRARKKSVGKERVAVDSKADRYLPA